MTGIYTRTAPWINMILGRFGFWLWGEFETVEDERGAIVSCRLVRVKIGRVATISED